MRQDKASVLRQVLNVWALRKRLETLLSTAAQPLCNLNDKLFTATKPLGARKRTLSIAPEPLGTRKHCYLFMGFPKHLLFVALEPHPLLEVAFEITIRNRIPVSPNSVPFHSAPLE